MKKKYSSKLAWIGATLCAFLLVACGLMITEVTLSAEDIEKGGEVTVTTKLMVQSKDDWENQKDVYLLYAIRVPEDWTYEDVVKVRVNHDGETPTLEFKESEAYTALAEFCFPEPGYKWLGFETTEQTFLDLSAGDDEYVTAEITLKAGEKAGVYNLDVISGSLGIDPSKLLGENGNLDINKAFGKKENLEGLNDRKQITRKDEEGEKTMEVYGLSLYLVCAATFDSKEEARYESLHLNELGDMITAGDFSYSICATADIQNKTPMDINVWVRPDIADLISIEGGEIEGDLITCEEEQKITFDVPEGYDLYYKLSEDEVIVSRAADEENEADEESKNHEHGDFIKYENGEAIELNIEHKTLECFLCNTNTEKVSHGDVAIYQLDVKSKPEVLPEIAELISIDGGMIDGNYITCEDDLTITFDIPEGYDIWYCLSTDGASVRRKAHGEEGEHDGFEKYEADKAIELTGEHKKLECFVCNPETGNHSEIASYTLDIATGVFEIGAEWTNNAPVYNLKGQRVYDTTAPGIYIKNGKKFIVK